MSALPRGRCLVCGSAVALRRGGQLREHRATPAMAPGRFLVKTIVVREARVCEGSGNPGAIGDGVADDTAAVQAAFDTLAVR